jgi:hypothetical protein
MRDMLSRSAASGVRIVAALAIAAPACSGDGTVDRSPEAGPGAADGGSTSAGGGAPGSGGASNAGAGGVAGLAARSGGASGRSAGGFDGKAGSSGSSGSGGALGGNGGNSASGGKNGASGGSAGAPDRDGGTAGDAAPSGGPNLTAVKVGPPFVAVGYATLRAYSSDGKSWTTAAAPSPLPGSFSGPPQDGDNKWLLRGVCTDGSRYVAVGGTGGDQGLVLLASGGQAWTVVGGVQANDDCAHGNGFWITPGRQSADAKNWTKAVTPSPSSRRIVFAGGIFVSVGDQGGGAVSYTRDGNRWTTLPIKYVGTDADRKGYNTLAVGNGRFLAMNSGRTDAPIFEWDGKSDTSFKETPRPPELSGAIVYTLAYGRGAFYIASFNALYRLPDGATTWEKLQGQGAKEIYSLVVTDDLFVDPRYWSADGVHWSASTGTPAFGITKVVGTPIP